MMPTVPFEQFVELSGLSEAGMDVRLAPSQSERARIAQWSDVSALPSFKATVTLKRLSPSRFSYMAELEADVVQSCVVTLEPVTYRIERKFVRELHLTRIGRHRPEPGELAGGASGDEGPEEIDSPHYNVAGPVLEEFSLAIDPYPRVPGVVFDVPEAPGPESPFAALARFKQPD